jgi:hypothetical protein
MTKLQIQRSNLLNIKHILTDTIITLDKNKVLKLRIKKLQISCDDLCKFKINPNIKLSKISAKINNLREELYFYIDTYGISDARTLYKSEELDAMLNTYSVQLSISKTI